MNLETDHLNKSDISCSEHSSLQLFWFCHIQGFSQLYSADYLIYHQGYRQVILSYFVLILSDDSNWKIDIVMCGGQ